MPIDKQGTMSFTDLDGLLARVDTLETHESYNAELVAGTDTDLHYHAADRDRANHTGDQSADTIVNGAINKVFTAAMKTQLESIGFDSFYYSATEPATPADGMLWLDTANEELSYYNGTSWVKIASSGTEADLTQLTDGGENSLHYHAADRTRSNHIGTQPASSISDFDSAVEANDEVAANTEKRINFDYHVNNNVNVSANTDARHSHDNKYILDEITQDYIDNLELQGIIWKGAYSGTTEYRPYQAVYYDGSAYVCTAETTGNLPTDTDYWDMMAQGASDLFNLENAGDADLTSPVDNDVIHYNVVTGKWENLPFAAQNVDYDNTDSGLAASDAKAAVDELASDKVDKVSGKGLSTEDYTTTEKSKLSNIEDGATADQTASEVKTLYENNADTNAYTDTEKSKLSNIEDGAEVNNISDTDASDLTSGGDTSLHKHDNMYYTEAEVDAIEDDLAGTGRTTETIKDNTDDLATHKTSDDHDGRYYTETEIDASLADKADKTNVLELDNTAAFTPDADYEPATKKYVDDSMLWYGLEWNQTEDTYIRLGRAYGRSVNNATSPHASDFNNVYPWAGMRRCNLADDGTVNAYYGDAGYTEDGSNGQVMVELPRFYCKATYNVTTTNKWNWLISPMKLSGYSTAPAFWDNGVEKDYIYPGAFEATVYDDSASAYAGDGITFDYANDKLASVADLQPLSGNTDNFDIGEARQMVQNRGPGWGLLDWTTLAALQMLYLVEYGDMYSQSVLSTGITTLDSGTGNHSQNTGHTSTLGNGSGDVTIAEVDLENGATGGDTYPMSYRGIENFYGNVYKFVDGILLTDSGYLIGDSIDDYNDAGTGYSLVSASLTTSDGYSSNFESLPGMISSFMPNAVAGSSSTHTTDYFYAHDVGETNIALFGRIWSEGAWSGAFALYCNVVASASSRAIGARILYK